MLVIFAIWSSKFSNRKSGKARAFENLSIIAFASNAATLLVNVFGLEISHM